LPREYDTRPRTLNHLIYNRARLRTSKNEAARTLGAALEKVHTQFFNREITPEDHGAQCNAIREAAEMINGSLDVEKAVLEKFGLDGLNNLKLDPDEYLAINDDLGRQLDNGNGVAATRPNPRHRRNASARGRTFFQRLFPNRAEPS
jgi:hypothetical protein